MVDAIKKINCSTALVSSICFTYYLYYD